MQMPNIEMLVLYIFNLSLDSAKIGTDTDFTKNRFDIPLNHKRKTQKYISLDLKITEQD